MSSLRQTDPWADKDEILYRKGPLRKEYSNWVLETTELCSWYGNPDTQLLWIKGDPGKGKTMMAIALIDELSHRLQTSPGLVSYFFCQNTDLRLNNATSVLRGLIYMLVTKTDGLAKPLKDEYKTAGSKLFEGSNVYFALQRILLAMLKIPNHGTIYLVVDALDECDSGLSELLNFITNNEFTPPFQVKWLITSRSCEEIKQWLWFKNTCSKVSLELNSSCVSRAVHSFVDSKVQELAQVEGYDEELKDEVCRHLKDNANGTFLWVALACKMLKNALPYKVRLTLKEIPPGLDSIYERMMGQILGQKDSDNIKNCKCIIISAILARRPLHLRELGAIADLPSELWEDLPSLKKLVQRCGSFLAIRKDIVNLVHQSAKDFFITGNGSSMISSSHQEEHGKIAYRSLDLMSNTLREDICDLQKPGTSVAEAQRKFSQSRFTHIEYACCYWADHLVAHLTDASPDEHTQSTLFNNGGEVMVFLWKHLLHWLGVLSLLGTSRDKHNQSSLFGNRGDVKVFLWKHLLHWLEVLSLLGKVSEGVLMFRRLQSLIDVSLLIR